MALPDARARLLRWPHPLLAKGLVLVDSPGLNESEQLNALVLSFMRHADAVGYVIDASRGTITEQDKRAFRNLQQICDINLFFVCNKARCC